MTPGALVEQNRRDVLKVAAPLFLAQRVFGANEKPTYGLIGAGGRGRQLSRVFQKLGCACAAVAEIYEPNAQLALKDSPDAKIYGDYHEMLQRPGLDFVVIATPDHQHAPNLYAALKAKKDVYLEKPMSHSLDQSKEMVKAVRATNQIVQIGMQRRSALVVRAARTMVAEGAIGRVTLAKAIWNWNVAAELDNTPLPGSLDWKQFLGPARDRELQPMRFRRWRYFWDYSGGNMTDQGTHLMDVMQWMTNNPRAKSAVCMGKVLKMTGAETPDVFAAAFEYPDGMLATWTLNYCNDYQNGWSVVLEGDRGTMVLNDGGYKIWGSYKASSDPIMSAQGGVPPETHCQNFLDCMKSRKEPNAPVEVGASAVSAPHLANLAWRAKREVEMP